jgi:hypothetical protein
MVVGLMSGFTADTRSSQYISLYRSTLTAVGDGKIDILVDVSGCGYMAEIGAKKIVVYESTDDASFTRVATYEAEDYEEMIGSGTIYFDTPITHEGVVGRYYMATVYCYAGNGTTGDTRSYTTASVRARA